MTDLHNKKTVQAIGKHVNFQVQHRQDDIAKDETDRVSSSNDLQPGLQLTKTKSAVTTSMEPRRRNRFSSDSKVDLSCTVCTDSSNGYNFGVVTCESCKAFFRRNANKKKPLECNFKGTCSIDKQSRKFCTKCRLDKCFTVGMKKDWILDEVSLSKRKKIVKRKINHEVKRSTQDGGDVPCLSPDQSHDQSHDQDLCDTTDSTTENVNYDSGSSSYASVCYSQQDHLVVNHHNSVVDHVPDTLFSDEEVIPPMPPLLFKPRSRFKVQSRSNQGQGSNQCVSGSRPLSKQYSDNIDPVPSRNTLPSGKLLENDTKILIPLTLEDQQWIQKLCDNYLTILNAPYPEKHKDRLEKEPEDMCQLFNLADDFIRRLITFSRKIPEFTALAQDDQIALLKGGVISIMLLRAAMELDTEKMSWGCRIATSNAGTVQGILHANTVAQVKEPDKGEPGDFSSKMQFFMSLKKMSSNDKTLLLILFIIEMFSPDRRDLTHVDAVIQAHKRYSDLLLHYIRSRFSLPMGGVLFDELLSKLSDLKVISSSVSKTASRLSSDSLEPLLAEMFNL